jgi:hypothetical protein
MAIPQHSRHLLRLRNQFAIIAAVSEQIFRMRTLKVTASDLMTRDLRRNRKYWHAIPMAIEEAVDEVKSARAATTGAHRNLPCKMSLRAGGKRGQFLMSYMKPF